MIYKAFDNDMVGGKTIKTFKRIKRTLVKGYDVRKRILSTDEFKALVGKAEGPKGIVTMGYYTGMRKGEILTLIWDKVDLANRMIRLKGEDTKDKEKETCPFVMNFIRCFYHCQIEKKEAVRAITYFCKMGVQQQVGLKRACKEAGITYGRFADGGFIFHDLRHTFNKNTRKAGVSESVIVEITEYSTREMFNRYNTIDEDDARKAVNQFERFVGNVT